MTTAREAPTFLLTPAQHLQWAERARRHNRPDLAFHHEQLRHFHRPQSGAVAQNVGDVDKAMTRAV